jgi:butyryl-CoA dehydrogenase
MPNPLIDDRVVGLILDDLLDVGALCALPHFAEHDRETFELYLDSARRLSREVLLPSYKPLDEDPPRLVDGHMVSPPELGTLFRQIVELGATAATRPAEVGGAQLPLCVGAFAHAYLMACNLSAYGYVGLTTGAAHLIEAYGDETLRERFMRPMYAGRWTGTMALTEPHAGSSLGDLTTRATPHEDGSYGIAGSKIFISAGEHDLAENIVHMVLARIDGAAAGTRGISLFAVPAKRPETDGALVDNDVSVAGAIHKIGWRGMPSLALNFGERGDCRGWLVGQPGAGLKAMFQMMNEARIWVGVNASATASVAYHEAVAYARDRPQGRRINERDPATSQIPIIEHADVRRMLLRQKAIVDGSLALCGTTAWLADRAEHAPDADEPGHQDLPVGVRLRGQRPLAADPRRVRLLQRVPARVLAPGSEAELDPRGDHRHPGARSARAQGHRGRRRRPALLHRAGDRGRRGRPRRWRGRRPRGRGGEPTRSTRRGDDAPRGEGHER